MRDTRTHLFLCPFLLLTPVAVCAQPPVEETASIDEDDGAWAEMSHPELALLTGLIQPLLLGGGNLELDLYWGRLVIGYSHGFLLNLQGDTVVGEAAQQGLAFHLPYSTGLSVGYRFLPWLDARLEGKVHRFEVRDEGTGTPRFDYTTVTLGVGVYAQYHPFRDFGVQADEWLGGFLILCSVRYWPNLWTSLPNDEIDYDHPLLGEVEHHAANIGIANTPLIVNVSVGYSVTF
jgi:hypothetical protein